MMGAPVKDVFSDGNSTSLEPSFLIAGTFPRVTTVTRDLISEYP